LHAGLLHPHLVLGCCLIFAPGLHDALLDGWSVSRTRLSSTFVRTAGHGSGGNTGSSLLDLFWPEFGNFLPHWP
jgi:hypothetical protein